MSGDKLRGAIQRWRYRRAYRRQLREIRERERYEHLYSDVDELPLHTSIYEFVRLVYTTSVRWWWP